MIENQSDLEWIQKKMERIVVAMSDLYNLPEVMASKIFSESETAKMIKDKVADLHCRSEKYLATLIMEEYEENNTKK